jgi:hypothetical protein
MKSQTGTTAIFREWKTQESRSILRLAWTGSLICFAEWSNLNFYLHQLLGPDYDAKDLVRLSFRAIPETEDEYSVEAEIALRPGVSPLRAKLVHAKRVRRSSASRKPATRDTPLSFQPTLIAPHRTLEEQEILKRIAALSTAKRLRFWQDNLASS